MLELMNGTHWTAFHGCKTVSFPFGILIPFTFSSKEVAGSAAQFNSSVSVAPPRCAQTNSGVSWRRRDGYTA